MMMRIKLTQEKFVLVDNEDFKWLNQSKWYLHKSYNSPHYATRTVLTRSQNKQKNIKKKEKKLWMHREIMQHKLNRELLCNEQIDHINRNTLDNQRSNLRLCTNSQNQMNMKSKTGSSKYKGVNWHKQHKKWQSRIQFNKRQINLGYFDIEIEAAIAYNQAALKYFGEFARLNIIEDYV